MYNFECKILAANRHIYHTDLYFRGLVSFSP